MRPYEGKVDFVFFCSKEQLLEQILGKAEAEIEARGGKTERVKDIQNGLFRGLPVYTSIISLDYYCDEDPEKELIPKLIESLDRIIGLRSTDTKVSADYTVHYRKKKHHYPGEHLV